jgi:hypothetical protein
MRLGICGIKHFLAEPTASELQRASEERLAAPPVKYKIVASNVNLALAIIPGGKPHSNSENPVE